MKKKRKPKTKRNSKGQKEKPNEDIGLGSTTSRKTKNDSNHHHGGDIDKNRTPDGGWVLELRKAKKIALKKGLNEDNLFRLAKAYRVLRQWDKLKGLTSLSSLSTAAETTAVKNATVESLAQKLAAVEIVAIETDETTETIIPSKTKRNPDQNYQIKLLKNWHNEAKEHLTVRSKLHNQQGKDFFKENTSINVDELMCDHQLHNNLNMLQCAAFIGDMPFLEKAVALGASIDLPVSRPSPHSNDDMLLQFPAPIGSTALVLACALLALNNQLPRRIQRMLRSESGQDLNGILSCAIQLVKLGANCNAKLKLHDPMMNHSCRLTSSYLEYGLGNKTALDLAKLSGKRELVQVMKQYRKEEDAISLVHCRCGSRLPWNQCHVGSQDHHFKNITHTNGTCNGIEIGNGSSNNNNSGSESSHLVWRLSPLAKCNCDLTDKNYYSCCWEDRVLYKDDSTGTISTFEKLIRNDHDKSFFNKLTNGNDQVLNMIQMNHGNIESVVNDDAIQQKAYLDGLRKLSPACK